MKSVRKHVFAFDCGKKVHATRGFHTAVLEAASVSLNLCGLDSQERVHKEIMEQRARIQVQEMGFKVIQLPARTLV